MKMTRTILIIRHVLLVSILLPKSGHTQLEADNWMFGFNQYVNFNHGTYPDTIHYPNLSSQAFFGSGCTSYSDQRGNLLFYGVGGTLFDKNFQLFPSLVSLMSDNLLNYVYSDATQPVLTIPYPGHDSLFIRFHIWSNIFNNYKSQLCYSIIDMRLRNGLGEIDPVQRNVLLFNGDPVALKLTAVLHCNKKDIWVVGHLLNSDQYYSLLVTQNGISTTPTFFTGSYISSGSPPYSHLNKDNYGCIKVSASGNRLGSVFRGLGIVDLMDFNTQTGVGSNLQILDAVPPPQDTIYDPSRFLFLGPFGLDFSPSGDKLYVTGNYAFRTFNEYPWGTYLFQYDVAQPTTSLIQNSRLRIDSVEGVWGGAIQIANNGRMYVNIQNHLSEIADPENPGLTCNYQRFKVWSGLQYPDLNLPIYVQSFFRFPMIATGNCQFQNISFVVQNLSGVSNIVWDFGDLASGMDNTSTSFTPTHIFSQEGSYEVKAVLYHSNGCGADTIRKIVHAGPFKVFLGNDTTICETDTLRLSMQIPDGNNLWSDNSRDTVFKVTSAGTYWVRVNIGDCFTTDTITVNMKPLPVFSLGDDITVCNNQSVSLASSNNPPGASYIWSTGSGNPSITVNTPGLYWLKLLESQYGCHYSDSIKVQFKTLPNYSLGADTSLCEGSILTLNASVSGASDYLWASGDISSTITISQSGIYWADVTKDQCTYRDSIEVDFNPLPIVKFGNDTTLCVGNTLVLNAGNTGSQYSWQNNSVAQNFTITSPGEYFVKVTLDACSASDTINILYNEKPVFTLGPDFGVCEGQPVLLRPEVESSSSIEYLWQNGSSGSSFAVTQTGQYSLDVTNYCGTTSDVVNVEKGVCKLYIPSAFSPNADGLNDIFKAEHGENVIEFQLEIYNRWGQKVFQSKSINTGWDGKRNEILQPNGVYIWTIRFRNTNDLTDKLLKGTVVLIR
jgi:gliding motility-associated-like protein